MNMKSLFALVLCLLVLTSDAQKIIQDDFIIGEGQMPNVTKDFSNNIHIVYGSGDSILYSYSKDNANSFSKPSLVALLPKVFTFATRGPQIAVTKNGLVITAVTSTGNIHSFYKLNSSIVGYKERK